MAAIDWTMCKHVYLDVGSNIGVQIRKLYEPELYPGSSILKVFDEYFGSNITTRRREVCAMGFEPNPHHMERLTMLKARYNALGWRTDFMLEAAGYRDGTAELFFDMVGKRNHSEWAAGLIRNKLNQGQQRWNTGRTGAHRKVHVFDLPQWMLKTLDVWKQHWHKSAGDNPRASVVMKLDVEGAEYELLPHLFASGALCLVNYVYAELHPHIVNFTISDEQNWRHSFEANLTAMQKGARKQGRPCPVMMTELDDESYVQDGNPFP